MMRLTPAQQEASAARGNVLVVAGAGTGKTSTVVERCLDCLLHEQPTVGLDEILLVTFTEAAAAEMRQRLRMRLETEAARQPGQWQEHLALFESAQIGTLHSFCLQLVRQHFYELELDPQLTVLAEEEARLLAEETLEKVLQRHYAGRDPRAQAVRQLIQAQGRGSDRPVRYLVLRLHRYSQALPDPAGWLSKELAAFAQPEPRVWQEWLLEGLRTWRQQWAAPLERLGNSNALARHCGVILKQLSMTPSRAEMATALSKILAAKEDGPKKNNCPKPLKDFLGEAEFLSSLAQTGPGPDPLAEDWGWVRPQMTALLELVSEFAAEFRGAKRELGAVDFQDLEQYALQLLWDRTTNQPSVIAEQCRERFRFIFVDEYQDINAAQDKVIETLSRQGKRANRFLVGDVKQSIYRFRLANPRIFQRYVQMWSRGPGRAIALVDNFRSREGILEFVNGLFGEVMQPELGGVAYDEGARLQFGAPAERRALSALEQTEPCVGLELRLKHGSTEEESEPELTEAMSELEEMEEAEKEARRVALELRKLHAAGFRIWDEAANEFRPARWADMAILLRAPSGKADSYAKAFSHLGIPLQVAKGGFYRSSEISDLLSLLQLLDNPLQDIPTLAVLRSPLVGLTLNELATIRLAVRKAHFWTALQRWWAGEAAKAPPDPQPAQAGAEVSDGQTLYAKVSTFLERFKAWRHLARQVSLSRCLEAVLAETHYGEWLLTQPGGEQCHANVQRLLTLAEQFDQFQRQGLFRFLRFIEGQQLAEVEPEVPSVNSLDAVRLMSIHQSKGLEFPVVVVADLGKPFNTSDLREQVILDEQYGLCPQIKPPHTGKRYPSLPYWLARRRQLNELLGEELRLLYVAMTRARERLLLSATMRRTRFEKLQEAGATPGVAPWLEGRSYADWLAIWLGKEHGEEDAARVGARQSKRWFSCRFHEDDTALLEAAAAKALAPQTASLQLDPKVLQELQTRLGRSYRFTSATRQPAKTSVSALRNLAGAADDEHAVPVFRFAPAVEAKGKQRKPRLSAAEIGTAHHAFLGLVNLERTGSIAALREEAERLRLENVLDPATVACLEFERLAAFWDSDLGRKLRAQSKFIRRELSFTARFGAAELRLLVGAPSEPELSEEFVVVQGVADLVVVLPRELWLLDYKTDALASKAEVEEKTRLYRPQLQLYALALSRIFRRPVTHCWLYYLGRDWAEVVSPAEGTTRFHPESEGQMSFIFSR